jgi:acyl phosphate:glycerol-3-phosphate acyltransferase
MTCALVIIFLSYLCGSLPTGYLIGRSRGLDIRKQGSGNIGATNVARVLGRRWGIAVFLVDAAKGFVAVMAAVWLSRHFPLAVSGAGAPVTTPVMAPTSAGILGAIWCILGHNFPIWLGFKGGKGVATSLGVLLGLVPVSALAALAIWVVVFLTTRYVSVASLIAAAAVPLVTVWRATWPADWPVVAMTIVAAILVFWRHKANISRLRQGTEHRFERKKK